jgi:hypothetical protein
VRPLSRIERLPASHPAARAMRLSTTAPDRTVEGRAGETDDMGSL